MSERPRFRRPPLERTSAIRNWTTLFGAPPASGADNGGSTDDANDDAARDDDRPGAAVEDVVARSVGLGYRVIDEYIQQGERVARSLGDRSYGTATMVNDAQAVATRMAQYATEMTSLWFEFAGLAARGSGFPLGPMGPFGAAPTAEPGAAPATAPSPSQPPLRLRVAIASSRPAEATIDVRLEGAVQPIVASALRPQAQGGTRIIDLAVEAAEAADLPLTLRIHVPDDQPAGDYEGTLVDDTGRSVGWITLRVGAR